MCVEVPSYDSRMLLIYIMVSKVFQHHSAEVRGWVSGVWGFGIRGVVYVNESDKYLIAFQDVDHNRIGIGQRMGEVVSDGV
jgi:hypothetical protein